jgi:Flp pilus assembly protein TadG
MWPTSQLSKMRPGHRPRRGAVAVLAALCLIIVIAFLAFAIDIGYMVVTESQLQNAADSGALSAARALPSGRPAAVDAARSWAAKNVAAGASVATVASQDVEIGLWDRTTASFSVLPESSTTSPNAVRVSCRRSSARGNPLRLFFAPVIGTSQADLTARAIAVTAGGLMGTRFLIDDEMIDTDVPAIERLAKSTGVTTDKLLKARGLNKGKRYGSSTWTWADNFLDLPAGTVLSLPTGSATSYSNNDAGMFDIKFNEFPFSEDATFREFLMYSETGGDTTKWGGDSAAVRGKLDPLKGSSPVWDATKYRSYVDPDFIHISPVSMSDLSTLSMQSGVPQINAKGLRRGLIAFKIINVGVDIDGTGSVLPELVIEVVDPSSFSLKDMKHVSKLQGGNVSLVQ